MAINKWSYFVTQLIQALCTEYPFCYHMGFINYNIKGLTPADWLCLTNSTCSFPYISVIFDYEKLINKRQTVKWVQNKTYLLFFNRYIVYVINMNGSLGNVLFQLQIQIFSLSRANCILYCCLVTCSLLLELKI